MHAVVYLGLAVLPCRPVSPRYLTPLPSDLIRLIHGKSTGKDKISEGKLPDSAVRLAAIQALTLLCFPELSQTLPADVTVAKAAVRRLLQDKSFVTKKSFPETKRAVWVVDEEVLRKFDLQALPLPDPSEIKAVKSKGPAPADEAAPEQTVNTAETPAADPKATTTPAEDVEAKATPTADAQAPKAKAKKPRIKAVSAKTGKTVTPKTKAAKTAKRASPEEAKAEPLVDQGQQAKKSKAEKASTASIAQAFAKAQEQQEEATQARAAKVQGSQDPTPVATDCPW